MHIHHNLPYFPANIASRLIRASETTSATSPTFLMLSGVFPELIDTKPYPKIISVAPD